MIKYLPRFSHDRGVTTITCTTSLALEHVEIMTFVVAVLKLNLINEMKTVSDVLVGKIENFFDSFLFSK